MTSRCPNCGRRCRDLAAHQAKCNVVGIETLVAMRKALRGNGACEYGLNARIAHGVGISKFSVKVRLWRYDQQQKGASR